MPAVAWHFAILQGFSPGGCRDSEESRGFYATLNASGKSLEDSPAELELNCKAAMPPESFHCHLSVLKAGSSFKTVIQLVWRNQLVSDLRRCERQLYGSCIRRTQAIIANFTLTTFCYPGLITAIPCRPTL